MNMYHTLKSSRETLILLYENNKDADQPAAYAQCAQAFIILY